MSKNNGLDEDELLQIALKEQAQRHRNYQRPSSQQSSRPSKPVANFVQPPRRAVLGNQRSSLPKMAVTNGSQTRGPQQRQSVDEDDDSEVEMLSISSGDEDSSKDRGFGAKNRAASGGRGGRDDERAWDGGEPNCWKRVSEAELARRVRGMRETRAVPVVQKFEQKPAAMARKGLNKSESFTRDMECVDPLGLGIIDNTTLRLIGDHLDSSPSKSDKDHLDSNLRESCSQANSIRIAAGNYLLDAGVQWGGAPPVKGVRDAAVELLHTLVAVHAEVFAGCKPLLDKTLGILVEGLIDTFISLFHENKTKDLRSLDANGFCQLMLELEYFETILNPYFTPDASESLKSLQGVLLEKATENVSETIETPGHHRRPTRGSEDAVSDDRQQGTTVSPDDLISLAQQYSSELLQAELERTRINTACFVESIPLDSVPESAKAAYASFKGSMDSTSRSFRGMPVGSPGFSRQRRR